MAGDLTLAHHLAPSLAVDANAPGADRLTVFELSRRRSAAG